MMTAQTNDQAYLWKPRAFKGITLLKARFKDFVYTKHVHEEFGIGVIEQGTQRFEYRGATHVAPAGSMITVNPDMVHDGEAATDAGYQYRMAYVPTDAIQEILSEISGSADAIRYFRTPVTHDPDISQQFLHALRLCDQEPDNFLEVQTALLQALADLFLRHAQPHYAPTSFTNNPAVIRRACELIRANIPENLSLDEIAREAGVSKFHFLRLFKAATGLSPHAYLLQRRLELAKALIEQGYSLIRSAHEAGFADQSHLTRRFKATYGITPGQYQHALLK